jgi:two-component system, sensor histidine kinase
LTARTGLRHSGSEFGLLAGSFDSMASALERQEAERRAAAAEMAAGRALLDAVIEGVPDPIFVKDARGRYILLNTATARVHGRPREDIQGLTDADLISASACEAVRAADRHVMATGMAEVLEEIIHDPVTGQERLLSSAKAPLRDPDGGIIGVIGVARDITERWQVERSMAMAKAEAERANLSKSRFLAAASHDLRQPTQAMFLFTSILREQLEGHPALETLESLQKALDAQKVILDGLSDMSRLDAGLVVPRVVDVALGPIIDSLVVECQPLAETREIRLRAVTTKTIVRTDPDLLRRMLRNLVENAIRFTDCGSVLIGCRRQGEQVRLEVLDTGAGIDSGEADLIWEEFYQIGNPERDCRKGLGLGLALVRRLGRLLDHEVGLRSTPGLGSVFYITLNRSVEQAGDPDLPTSAATGPARAEVLGVGGARRSRIIVIDDEALIRISFKMTLEGWGYEVLAAGSQDEAMRVVSNCHSKPHLIIADYRLREGRTGTQAIRAIRRHCGVRIPAIVVTGDAAPNGLSRRRPRATSCCTSRSAAASFASR